MNSNFDASGFSDVSILVTSYVVKILNNHGGRTDWKGRIDQKQAYIYALGWVTLKCVKDSFSRKGLLFA